MKKLGILLLFFIVASYAFSQDIRINEWNKQYDVNDWGEKIDTYTYGIFEEAEEIKSQTDCLMLFAINKNSTSISIILPGHSSLYKKLLLDENKIVSISYRNKIKEDTINALVWEVYDFGENTAVNIVPLLAGKNAEAIHGFRDIFKMFLTSQSFDLLVKTNFVHVKTTFKGLELSDENIEIYLFMSVIAPDVECVKKVFKYDNKILYNKNDSGILKEMKYLSKMHTYDFLKNKWLDNIQERNEILQILNDNGLEQVKGLLNLDDKLFYQY